MNHKFVQTVAAFLIVGIVLSAVPLSYAQTTILSFGPKLEVVTIPQDYQEANTGVMILGLGTGVLGAPALTGAPTDFMSQHKLLITYNGMTLTWAVGTPGPLVFCNFLEKDKVNVVADPKTGLGKQGSYENLMTTLVDVSAKFICKVRWKSPAPGVLESAGVLDVYYTGPNLFPVLDSFGTNTNLATAKSVGYWIADTIMVVEASLGVGRTVIFGSDLQDICVLGWAVTGNGAGPGSMTPVAPTWIITKPDGTQHYIWQNPMGAFHSCEDIALAQRDLLGIPLPQGQDPLSTT